VEGGQKLDFLGCEILLYKWTKNGISYMGGYMANRKKRSFLRFKTMRA